MSTETLFDTLPEEKNMGTDLVEHQAQPIVSLVAMAIERGVDADQLGKLLAMQEREQAKHSREAYNVAMKACQEEMPIVVRDKMNTATSKKYATLETVSERIKPIYTKHGFSLSYGTVESPKENHVRIVCDCMHDAGHTEKHQLDCPYDTVGMKGTANKTPIQGMGSTISYGRRYLKLMIFDVTVADEDNDGQDSALINELQLAQLEDAIAALGVKTTAYTTWMQIEHLSELPSAKFNTVWAEILRKGKEKGVQFGA